MAGEGGFGEVDGGGADGEGIGDGGGAFVAAEEGADAGEEFFEGEGFDEVVVGAAVENSKAPWGHGRLCRFNGPGD